MTRVAGLVVVAAALAVGVGGCGGDDGTADATTQTTTMPAASSSTMTDKVDIADFKYDPEAIEVAAGSEVTWTNSDSAPHTATADDSSFDTGDLDKGDTASVTFDQPGRFTYYCRFHPFMKATVEVQ